MKNCKLFDSIHVSLHTSIKVLSKYKSYSPLSFKPGLNANDIEFVESFIQFIGDALIF